MSDYLRQIGIKKVEQNMRELREARVNKPREFNLEFSDLCYDDWDCKVTVDKGTDSGAEPRETIRVIEKSAFARQAEEIARLRELVREAEFVIRDNEELSTTGAAWLAKAKGATGES